MSELYYYLRARMHQRHNKAHEIPLHNTLSTPLEAYYTSCQSGDLFFSNSNHWTSQPIKNLTKSHYTDVGIIMRSPHSYEAYILTANESAHPLFGLWKHSKKVDYQNKVDLTPLKVWVEHQKAEFPGITFALRPLMSLQQPTFVRRQVSELIAHFAVSKLHKKCPTHRERWKRYQASQREITHRGKPGQWDTFSSSELCFLAMIHAKIIQDPRIGLLEAPWSIQVHDFEGEGKDIITELESHLNPGYVYGVLTDLI